MKSAKTKDLWAAYLENNISSADEMTLMTAIGIDEQQREHVLQDAEMHGMLRSAGRKSPDDIAQFVATVIERIETESPVPTQDPVGDETATVTANTTSQQTLESNLEPASTPETGISKSLVWVSLAVIAASVLVVVTLLRNTNQENTLPNSNPDRAAVVQNQPKPKNNDASAVVSIPDASDPNSPPFSSPPQNDSVVATPETTATQANPKPKRFAKLIKTSDGAQWYENPRSIDNEFLSLLSGSAKFETASGAMVSITAPAQFQFDSANSLLLAGGQALANVPPKASGFSVETPVAQLVDLGTEFSTQVLEDGACKVHVSQGTISLATITHPEKETDPEKELLEAGHRRFVDASGRLLAWKLQLSADIFGEVVAIVNGIEIRCRDLEDFRELKRIVLSEISDSATASGSAKAHYTVNRIPLHTEPKNDASKVAELVKEHLILIESVVKQATSDSGAFNLANRSYVYDNLQEKLQARRKIARKFGTRAFPNNTFRFNEEFTTTGAPEELDNLQKTLNERLNVINLPIRKPSAPRNVVKRKPVVIKPDTNPAASPAKPSPPGLSAERARLRIEEMIQRKSKSQLPR